ncbi:MAG TPA: antitoxin Xre/MbcA/ParS toxin-binding domain-containing protein [Longimicrobiaceae bacterium]|jgi:putative toxin-antitoxin system antitoxin component (TIGR02293 family)|nr:antitoxin Xre/MbcA/ParS toxin-binding domain-containing protein [Longimicrobiaceae bacterium]
MTVTAQNVARILGGNRTFGKRIVTVADLRRAVEGGLPVTALDQVVSYVIGTGPGAAELRHSIVPKTTLRRRLRLSAEESERLERLARMTALAEQVWESADLAHEFLTSPQPQLGDERPIDLARSDLGTREVEEVLMRIEYSLPV